MERGGNSWWTVLPSLPGPIKFQEIYLQHDASFQRMKRGFSPDPFHEPRKKFQDGALRFTD